MWISYQRSEPCHGKCVLLSSSARSPLAPSRPMPRPLEPRFSGSRRRLKACGSTRAALAPAARRLGGHDLVAEVGRAGAQAELVDAPVHVERRDRAHVAPAPGIGPSRALQIGVEAGGEALDRVAYGLRRAVRRLAARELLHRAHVLDALVEEVGLQVAVLGPEVARALRVDRDHDVGQLAQLILRVRVAVAEAQRPVVGRLDVGPAARRPPHLGAVALLGRLRGHWSGEHGQRRDGREDSPPHLANPMRSHGPTMPHAEMKTCLTDPLRRVQARLEGSSP